MIRPWYRSRLFWLGLPGLVFLLWGWWNSGAYSYTSSIRDRWTCDNSLLISISEGSVGIQFPTDSVLHGSVADLELCTSQVRLTNDGAIADLDPHSLQVRRMRQFDLPPAFNFRAEWDGALGDDPAADGWIPSPGYFSMEIALWVLGIVYLGSGCLILICWQRRKARLSRRAAVAVEPGS